MKKLNCLLVSAASLLAGSSYLLWHTLDTQTDKARIEPDAHKIINQGSRERGDAGSPAVRKGELMHQHSPNPWQTSPFEVADGERKVPNFDSLPPVDPARIVEPEKEIVSDGELARRKKMIALGYMVPTDYYSKDVKTLKQLAKAGDAYAMVHLGEKYYFELNGQIANPEFERGLDYPVAAKQAFKDALVAGNVRSAGIIAEIYFQEKNPTEAYAWHLVSDQLGDDISAEWFRRTDMAKQASPEIRQAAAIRAAQILRELKLPKKSS